MPGNISFSKCQAFIFAASKALMCRPNYSSNCNCSVLPPSFLKATCTVLYLCLYTACGFFKQEACKPSCWAGPHYKTSTQEPPSLVLFKLTWSLHAEEGFRYLGGAAQKDFSCGLFIKIQVPSSLATLS